MLALFNSELLGFAGSICVKREFVVSVGYPNDCWCGNALLNLQEPIIVHLNISAILV